MKQKFLLLLLGSGFGGFLSAQSITPEVLATTGGEGTASSTTVQWTVGEAVTATFTGTSNLITQGFHQPQYTLVAVDEPPFSGLILQVFPNPAQEAVFLSYEQDIEGLLMIDLVDLTGQVLAIQSATDRAGRLEFDLRQLSDGQYFLRVRTETGSFEAYKIQKIH